MREIEMEQDEKKIGRMKKREINGIAWQRSKRLIVPSKMEVG
jgi:hypothetical protein